MIVSHRKQGNKEGKEASQVTASARSNIEKGIFAREHSGQLLIQKSPLLDLAVIVELHGCKRQTKQD